MQLPKLVFHLEWGDLKTPERTLEIRDQPLSHETTRLLAAIGDDLSALRKLAPKKKKRRSL